MIIVAVLAFIGLLFFVALNAVGAEKMHEKAMCSTMIMVMSFVLIIAVNENEPLKTANYYINHQDEFVVDTISVNGVITELKIREK